MILPIDTDYIFNRDLFGEVMMQQFFDNEDIPKHQNEYTSF